MLAKLQPFDARRCEISLTDSTDGEPHRASVEIVRADLDDAVHAAAIVELIDAYARTDAGQAAPLNGEQKAKMIPGIKDYPQMFTLLAIENREPVGAAVCYRGFSTFRALPFINIHDLVVSEERRGRGVGTRLIEAVFEEGRRIGACKVTLEVHASNNRARRLYRKLGFGPWDSPTLFVTRML